MNKRSRILGLLLLPLVLVLASCMRMQSTYSILDLENVEVNLSRGIDKEVAKQQAGAADQICKPNSMPAGTTLKPYEDDKYVGCVGTGKLKVSDIKEIKYDEAKKVWTFAMTPESDAQAQGLGAGILSDFKIAVTFPGKVLSHSGKSTVSGNTVTWTDPNDLFSAEGLVATAEHGSGAAGFPAWLWVVIGVVAAAAIVAVVFFVVKRKGQSAPAQGVPQGQPYPPQQPGPAQPTGQPNQSWSSPPPADDSYWRGPPGSATEPPQANPH